MILLSTVVLRPNLVKAKLDHFAGINLLILKQTLCLQLTFLLLQEDDTDESELTNPRLPLNSGSDFVNTIQ